MPEGVGTSTSGVESLPESEEERLPEVRTRVICQFDNGDIELLWQDWESDTESLTYWTDFDFMTEKKVIAWRPLPDPYQTERRR